jgi:hypothetical protein
MQGKWNKSHPDGVPKTWKKWDELTDDAVFKVLNAMVEQNEIHWMQFALYVLQHRENERKHRENERNNKIMRKLMWATLAFTAISALFVGLSVFKVI